MTNLTGSNLDAGTAVPQGVDSGNGIQSLWIKHILSKFPADLARLWIAADPDGVLLDEQILSVLKERGFEVLPFEESIAFRAEYEERYREAWDRNEEGSSKALILHLRSAETQRLPWDYLRQARTVRLGLANLFPKLSYTVIRQIGAEHLEALFEAQERHAAQSLGETATKEFILTHIYRINPHLITRPEDFWRELLRLHYCSTGLPRMLAEHIAQILADHDQFEALPIADLFASKSTTLRVAQEAWREYIEHFIAAGDKTGGEPPFPLYWSKIRVPFDHQDVRVLIDSMFLDGTLHPVEVKGAPQGIPEWVKVGIVQDPSALRDLVRDGVRSLLATMPDDESTYRDWGLFAKRFAEILARFHTLPSVQAETVRNDIGDVQRLSDIQLQGWVRKHYGALPSLPAARAPVLVHHVPRFLSMRRNADENKVALVVMDGLALDQWVLIRDWLESHSPRFGFEAGTCFSWLPSLTSVSRQALFSGMLPRGFADSIETTAQEPSHWSRFWQDQGLRANEVFYRKGIKRIDQLDELESALSANSVKVAGIVVDTVDEIVHGAVLGKRGIAAQIANWCESGFVDRLFSILLNKGYAVYLTADHGNVDAIGVGRPNQGMVAEARGERVRIYRSETLITESVTTYSGTVRIDIAGLPGNFMPLFAGDRTAFVTPGEQLVVHGGVSVEEMIVPFVQVSFMS